MLINDVEVNTKLRRTRVLRHKQMERWATNIAQAELDRVNPIAKREILLEFLLSQHDYALTLANSAS